MPCFQLFRMFYTKNYKQHSFRICRRTWSYCGRRLLFVVNWQHFTSITVCLWTSGNRLITVLWCALGLQQVAGNTWLHDSLLQLLLERRAACKKATFCCDALYMVAQNKTLDSCFRITHVNKFISIFRSLWSVGFFEKLVCIRYFKKVFTSA